MTNPINLLLDESKQVSIDGCYIKGYSNLKLNQRINDHHTFTVYVDIESIELQGAYTIDKSKEWLGKTINIETHGKDFVGIITNISLDYDDGPHGQIIVEGFSSTILLENGEDMHSWLNKDLKTIAEEITKHARLRVSIKPKHTQQITYECQYAESNFQFLRRLAKQYHEWLFYDGDLLFFGKPELDPPVLLIYGQDATEMKIGIQTKARKYKSYSHNSFTNEKFTSESPDKALVLNELGQHAFNASLENYKKATNFYAKKRIGNKKDLDDYLKFKQQSEFANSNVISLKTTKRGLTVGSVIDLRTELVDGLGSVLNKRHGEYIVIEIEHYAAVGNHYTNKITALPAGIQILPEPEIDFPIARTQMATVVDNLDPKGKGRVQVRMNWQIGSMTTSWIRVLTPDAGTSDKVSANRGFVFIPEKGDQVLVSFRYDDPNRPFVMGSLFNGNSGTGGDKGNKIKSLSTRSGNSLILNDKSGSVTLKDHGTVNLNFDGSGTATLNANVENKICVGDSSATLSMDKEGNINIEGTTEFKLTIGESSLKLSKDGTIELKGKDILIHGSSSVTTKSTGIVKIDENVTIEGGEVNIN